MTATPRPFRCYDRNLRQLAETIPPLAKQHVVVMGGFIASTEDGVTTTLGRGGSDFTAAIVGAGIGAEEIQIWTDVDGMLTADPTIIPGGHRVKAIRSPKPPNWPTSARKFCIPRRCCPRLKRISQSDSEFAEARSGRHPHQRRSMPARTR